MKTSVLGSILTAVAAFHWGAHIQASPVNIAISTIGNPGNAPDTGMNGVGSVGYVFGIGTYDVTLTQYTAFLNAVAKTDTYGLYNPNMATELNVAGILQTGVAGNFHYSVIGDGQRPVTYVSWLDAARFCNWLSNGQPGGLENAQTTETGAYTLNGDTTGGLESRNPSPKWWLPTWDEWHKAAFYDPSLNGRSGGYWIHATMSNTIPGNLVGSGSNQANYRFATPTSDIYSVTQSATYDPNQNYLTPVGAFSNSASAYGTYDQEGDVYNWTDSLYPGGWRGIGGNSWAESAGAYGMSDLPLNETAYTGFRVATVKTPEPSAIILMGLAAILLASARRNSVSTRTCIVQNR